MKFQTKNCKISYKQDTGKYLLVAEIPDITVDKLNNLCKKDCIKDFEIKQHREKRSLNANAYCWSLLHKIAQSLCSTDEEVYNNMLDKYGHHQYVGVVEDAVPMLKAAFKRTKVVGTCKLNDTIGVTVKCTLGSSTYDSKLMSTFINGIVQEAKELNIETMTNIELERMLNNNENAR